MGSETRHFIEFFALMALVFVAVGFFVYAVNVQEDHERQDCVEQGGRIEEIHGYHRGWICAGNDNDEIDL